jgi:hypothetical protein
MSDRRITGDNTLAYGDENPKNPITKHSQKLPRQASSLDLLNERNNLEFDAFGNFGGTQGVARKTS